MDRRTIIAGLKEEIDALNRAIEILEGSGSHGQTASAVKKPAKRGGRRKMSAEGRARIAAATKARWAKIRKDKEKDREIR